LSRRNGERTGEVTREEMTVANCSEFPIHDPDRFRLDTAPFASTCF
jgi:hypothetical protein